MTSIPHVPEGAQQQRLATPTHGRVHCVQPAEALLGEGVVWSPREQCLYWVDILGRAFAEDEFDWVHSAAEEIPMWVFSDIMGLPVEDRKLIIELGDKILGNTDPEVVGELRSSDDPAALQALRVELASLENQLAHRQAAIAPPARKAEVA